MSAETKTFGYNFTHSFEAQEAKKPNHEEGSLRDELLSAPEVRGNFVFIPMGTVAVEGNSRTLTPENLFENSDNVAKLREKQEYLTRHKEGNATRLRGGRHMSNLDREFRTRQDQEPNGNNLTFLYDEQAKVGEDELHVPSAVLVHEKLSEAEVARLRETLPADVPILDAKTNELLDAVGQEKREQRRERRLAEFDLGFVALAHMLRRPNFEPDMSSFIKRHTSRSFRASRLGNIDELLDEPIGKVYDDLRMSHNLRRDAADGFAYGRWDGASSQTTYNTPKTDRRQSSTRGNDRKTAEDIPESEEVREHRARQEAKAKQEAEARAYAEQSARAAVERRQEQQREAVDKHRLVDDLAKDKLGKSVYDLDDAELKSFYKKTSRELHPDVEGGNADSFRALNEVVNDIQNSRERQAPAEPTPEPEAEREASSAADTETKSSES